jgi:hypothetical protein
MEGLMASNPVYNAKVKFQKCLVLYARAATSGEAEAAATQARRIMEAHAINPWDLGDKGWRTGMGNFGRNALFQKLKEEYRAVHPPAPNDLVWAIDESLSIAEAVAYRAGDYVIVPAAIPADKWGSGYVVYSVWFGPYDRPLQYREKLRQSSHYPGDGSDDCMARAQKHHLRRLKEAKKPKLSDEEHMAKLRRDYPHIDFNFGEEEQQEPEVSVNIHDVNTPAAQEPEVGDNAAKVNTHGVNNNDVNTHSSPGRRKDRHRPRKGDRHKPGYMAAYMRKRRAEGKVADAEEIARLRARVAELKSALAQALLE